MPVRPNVLVYVSHDTGRHISPYGIGTVHTPNAQRVAAEGVLLERCFCTAPQCSPSRAALFTGRYPHSCGVMGLTHAEFAWDLTEGQTHANQHFAQLGYQTSLIGIAHEVRRREGLGFQFIDWEENAPKVGGALDRWLERRGTSDRPFYCQIGTFQTHRPFPTDAMPPDDALGVTVPPYVKDTPGTRADFAAQQGSIRQWDQGLGDVLRVLDDRGLARDTILVVTTDHGLAMPRAKCTLYDPGIGVMAMIRWHGGGVSGGVRYPQLISHVDILPTLLEAAGGEVPAAMQGQSFWPLLAGKPYRPRDRVFAEMTFHQYYDPIRCVRTDRFKYIRNFEMAPGVHVPSDVMVSPTFLENARHVLQPPRRPYEELYDLQADPLERDNLAGNPAFAADRARLAQDLARWMRETDDPILRGPVASPFYGRSVSGLTS